MRSQSSSLTSQPAEAEEAQIVHAVLSAIRSVRYGYVQLILQDGKVVQIDTLERTRLTASGK